MKIDYLGIGPTGQASEDVRTNWRVKCVCVRACECVRVCECVYKFYEISISYDVDGKLYTI